LINGVPLAMAPAGSTHGVIQSNIANLIINHLDNRGGPCVMMTNPGIIPAFRTNRNYFIPDAAVTWSEADIGVPGIRHPVVVIEILSLSNHAETWRNIRPTSTAAGPSRDSVSLEWDCVPWRRRPDIGLRRRGTKVCVIPICQRMWLQRPL
jgi:hypothetical protein